METEYLITLGSRIRSFRAEKGFSLHGLAALADTTPNRLESIEKGEIDPLAAELNRIAVSLGLHIKDLAG